MEKSDIKRIVIAGINGQFGRIFARKFRDLGVSICGLDLEPSASEQALCDSYICSSIADMTEAAMQAVVNSDCILLCVPEEVILASLPRLIGLIKDSALVIDIASVKTKISELLLSIKVQIGYLSIHPMFGPMDDFSGRSMGLVHMHENCRSKYFLGVMEKWGAHIVTLTASQHDSLTAFVQALPHAAIIAFASTLAESGLSFEMLWSVSTPIQKIMLALSARVVSGEHDTYWSIQSANPFAVTARERLGSEIGVISSLVSTADWLGFSAKLDTAYSFLSPSSSILEKLAEQCVGSAKSGSNLDLA